MLSRPDRVPRRQRAQQRAQERAQQRAQERAQRAQRRAQRRSRPAMSVARRFAALRWTIVGIWVALLVTRIVVSTTAPESDLSYFGVLEAIAITGGLVLIAVAVLRARAIRRRRADEALALAIRRIDPTVWLVPSAPTQELRDAVHEARPEAALGQRVTWAFGATEASLWELEERRATRLLVIRWSRMVHVGLEDVVGERNATAIALHYVRPDDTTAVATFFVRSAPGSQRLLGRGPRLERLVADLARERIVA